jgi:outer membrane protein W
METRLLRTIGRQTHIREDPTMKRTARIFVTPTLLVAGMLAASGLPATSYAQDAGWQLRLNGAWVDPSVDYAQPNDEGEMIRADSESAMGYGLALEYRASRRIGWELGVLRARPEIVLHGEVQPGSELSVGERVSFMPVTLGLNVHLTPDGPIDVYAGPVVGYVFFGDLTYKVSAGSAEQTLELQSGDSFAWGATLGADVALGRGKWSVGAALTYLDIGWKVTERASGGSETVDFDPLIATVGLRFRF